MKQKIAWLVLLALLFSLAGCGTVSSSQTPTSIKIGFCAYDQHDTFIGEIYEYLVAAARQKEAAGFIPINILYAGASGSQMTQNDQVEDMLRSGCQILLVNLVDRTDASTIIDKAEAAGVPVIFFNREPVTEDLERWDRLYYVGSIASDSGRQQGNIALQLYHENPEAVDRNGDGVLQYVMLEGEPGHQDAILRTELSVKTVEEGGLPVERLEDEIANWSRAQAETKMTSWLAAHGTGIELVLANNDDMALGAIDALLKAGVSSADWPLVIGVDATRDGLEAVQAGTMAGTVLNDGLGQAQTMLVMACAFALGQPVPAEIDLQDGKYTLLPGMPITRHDVEDFIRRREEALAA